MPMRITGGAARGRTIRFPAESKQRPTSDFLRQALFNLLGEVQEKSFLDLFAGSGSVGLEAVSRGAAEVVLVEKDKKIAVVAQKNIQSCGFADKCRVVAADIGDGLRNLNSNGRKFDIVFADPPYSKGLIAQTLELLEEYSVNKDNALVVIQHSIREDFSQLLKEKIIVADQRKYGDNALTFLKWEIS